MKLLVDMNLSPAWVEVFRASSHDAVHWSSVGAVDAEDEQIMAWAHQNGYVVLTNDLDFSAILASTQAAGPSVLQIRAQAVSPTYLAQRLLAALSRFEADLMAGALITIDEQRDRARILPIGRKPEPDDQTA